MRAPMSGDRTFHVVEAFVEPGDVGVATLRRRWPDEFKERAIAAALESGANVSAVARQMGISPAQLFGWRRKALAKVEASTAPTKPSSTEVVTASSMPVLEIVIGDTVIRVGADIPDQDRVVGRQWRVSLRQAPGDVRVLLAPADGRAHPVEHIATDGLGRRSRLEARPPARCLAAPERRLRPKILLNPLERRAFLSLL